MNTLIHSDRKQISGCFRRESTQRGGLQRAQGSFCSVVVLVAWRIPGTGKPGGLPPMGSQSRTWLKRPSSSSVSRSVVLDSVWPHGLWPTRLLCPWDSPRNNTGVDCHSLLQRIFPIQESNLGLLHCRQTLYPLSYEGNPPLCGSENSTQCYMVT